ncbi:hypothetical protein JCM19046_2372 [Bacillus sp. JCM 19046]|nr:hypothetical protein JCM19045_1805 [Bacillus sp. JCM 19045]GAF17841.1 hypothetical protein JCM19046_2372 [Bacillus sp. JCM 19046]
MTEDFYCDEVLSGKTSVTKILETEHVLAYHHTKPFYPVHIVAVPKKHILSLLTVTEEEQPILFELLSVIQIVAQQITDEYGACRVLTNLGNYQDSKHLHWHIAYGDPLSKGGNK